MSAGDNLVPHSSRTLRMARALASRKSAYDLSPAQIIQVRHMTRDGAELAEVMAVLGWLCTRGDAAKRLKKRYFIHPNMRQERVHAGGATALPPRTRLTDQRSFGLRMRVPA